MLIPPLDTSEDSTAHLSPSLSLTLTLTHTRRCHLSNVVEGEPGEEDVSEKLGHTEDPVHHPVGQPFSVVLFGGTFNGFDPEGGQRSTRLKPSSAPSSSSTVSQPFWCQHLQEVAHYTKYLQIHLETSASTKEESLKLLIHEMITTKRTAVLAEVCSITHTLTSRSDLLTGDQENH